MIEKIIEYITTQLINDDNASITEDDDLLGSGVLDSISAMKLIAFIEESFEVKVDPEDMVIENFMNVNSMVAFITEKKSALS